MCHFFLLRTPISVLVYSLYVCVTESVHVFLLEYLCMHVHLCVEMYDVQEHACTFTCVCACMRGCVHVCVCVSVYVCLCMRARMYTCVRVRMCS